MREFNALRRVWDEERKSMRWYYADIRAAIYNSWQRGTDTPPKTTYDFLPPSDRPKQQIAKHFGTQPEGEKKAAMRGILFDAFARKVAYDRQMNGGEVNAEAEAQLDALIAQDWTKESIN